MAHKHGTPVLNIPIQFHVGSSKLYWQIIKANGLTMFAGSWFSSVTMENIDLGDGWDLVRQYLSVKPTDECSILKFLVEHGQFDAPEGSRTSPGCEIVPKRIWSLPVKGRDGEFISNPKVMVLESLSIQEFAVIHDHVRRMLITGNPTLPTPWRARYVPRPYEIAFSDSHSGPRAHVLVRGTYRSILATVQFKLAHGAKFRVCARKDCRLPFEITSRHSRRFCTQYCAHITSLRQRRKAQRKVNKQI